jgi:CubicO group peptidase (beta-lactamase class C family)
LCVLSIAGAHADDRLSARIQAAVPEGFSGQVVVGNSGGILYSGSFGLADREKAEPVTATTLFDIGSITKTFTATAVLKLAADGKLGIDQTLADWFEGLPKATGAITLHQLLTHTSGLPLYSGDDDAPCDRGCFDAWLAATTPEFAPGERFEYSNPGYSALARIIEKASGMEYERYLDDALLTPLKTGPVGYRRLPEDAHYAVGYYEGDRVGTPPELGWADDGPSWHLRGNGGLICSATALFRWLQATANGRTLPAELQALQLTHHADRREGVGYGYGWGILDRPWGTVIDHTGGNGFFFADARWFREQGFLVAITNNAFDREQISILLQGLREALGVTQDTEK